MGTLAIDLHDVETIAGSSVELFSLPAVVRFDGDQLLIGDAALRGARHVPRQLHDRFYEQLSLEPLERPFPRSWRTADLAHAHLEALQRHLATATSAMAKAGTATDVILLTGGLDEARLPLLLGIAGALGLPIAGVAPSALAAVAGASLKGRPERCVHLGLYRHRAVATALEGADGIWTVRGIETNHDISWSKLRGAQIHAISRAFVRTTRYDPLATAEGEQQLYDRLPGWLAALERSERVDARLGSGNAVAAIELERAEFAEAAAETAQRLDDMAADAGTVLLDARAAALGVPEALRRQGRDVVLLDARTACDGALRTAKEIVAAGPGVYLQRLTEQST